MSEALAPDAFEERLRLYLRERAEESRAVRVGEKETSEQAAIVARHADLFTREQLEALLRARIRSAPVRRHLRRELGHDWWRRMETGDFLRDLFREGTRPTSEQVAHRLGFDPLDTAPLEHELLA